MTTCWILVADASRAFIYTSEKAKLIQGDGALELIHSQDHPEGRQKKQDMVTDKSGHHKSKGATQGAFIPATDPKKNEINNFARELAHLLDKNRNSNAYQELVVVAPEHIYGMLNKHLNPHVKDMIRVDVKKDYTSLKPQELMAQLSGYL